MRTKKATVAVRSPEARNELIAPHDGLVWSLVWRFYYTYPQARKEISKEDAFGYGCLGLILAGDCYDASHGTKFSTYAHFPIWHAITGGWQQSRLVHRPATRRNKVDAHEADRQRPVRRFGEEEDLVDVRLREPILDAIEWERDELLRRCLASINQRWATVLRMRLAGKTLAEVGAALGCTRQRVQQMEVMGIDEVRRWFAVLDRRTR